MRNSSDALHFVAQLQVVEHGLEVEHFLALLDVHVAAHDRRVFADTRHLLERRALMLSCLPLPPELQRLWLETNC